MADVTRGQVRPLDGLHEDTIWECQSAGSHKYKQEWPDSEIYDFHRKVSLDCTEVKTLQKGKCPNSLSE